MSAPSLTPRQRLSLAWMYQPDLALLLLRAIIGVVGIYHGGQKLFGWFGGSGVEGFAGFLGQLGVPLPMPSAVLAGAAEFFGGALILLGFGTRLAAIPFAFTMVVAIITVHPSAFDARAGGMEYPLTLAVVALSLVFSGPGRFSVDALARRAISGRTATAAVCVV